MTVLCMPLYQLICKFHIGREKGESAIKHVLAMCNFDVVFILQDLKETTMGKNRQRKYKFVAKMLR